MCPVSQYDEENNACGLRMSGWLHAYKENLPFYTDTPILTTITSFQTNFEKKKLASFR